MASNRRTVFELLNVTEELKTFDDKLLDDIRSTYNEIMKKNLQDPLKILRDNFMLVEDLETENHLKICITNSNSRIARRELCSQYQEKRNEKGRNASKAVHLEKTTTESLTTEYVSELICQIFIKQNQPAVIEFIHAFLLSEPNQTTLKKDIPHACVLDIFIRQYLITHGNIIDHSRLISKLPLVEPITLIDEFGTWHFDHLHGLFELNLIPNGQQFPRRWQLTPNAKLSYVIQTADQMSVEESTIRNIDRPSTISLQKFVEDVCEKENNGRAQTWLSALETNDISTFDDLNNLTFTEWDDLKTLTTNGKRILKLYVNQEKQMTSSKSTEQKHKVSQCELLANLHKSKLYFHHILAEQFALSDIPTPPKLDIVCVHAAFEEMRQDGFADDGLFDDMKKFFLPLTMTEKDLLPTKNKLNSLCIRKKESKELSDKRTTLITQLQENRDKYYRSDDSISKLQKRINGGKTTNQRQVTDGCKDSTEEEIKKLEKSMEQLNREQYAMKTYLQGLNELINNNNHGLEEPSHGNTKSINKDLIKPSRGFIMHGPPGTGKSDIMSKLSTRIGISMVAPSIAAGELNRPLVGQSERIISDICMRCHRIPYLMCCVSIDEIDALTSKRTDKSDDGNVAKLSVFLSVIDGIQDVSNLMIFCATNRLHMMDEAFLRRMQGKFFVGRPSSSARRSILREIKPWHLSSNSLEVLTVATTNFSGAALRALRRLITAHCIDSERDDPNYVLDYRTILELTNDIARQYRILIGAETLPMLLLKTTDEKSFLFDKNPRFNDLSNESSSIYTGKIIVNFNQRHICIEAIRTNRDGSQGKKFIIEQNLFEEETSLQKLVERLAIYGKSRNVQLLQLVDLNLLSSESAYNETDKFEILKDRLDECAAYRRSMIVYDLDSLVGVNRTENDTSMAQTASSSMVNHNIYAYIKYKFEDAYVEPSRTSSDLDIENSVDTKERWSIVILSDPFLVRQFYDNTKFTRSQRQIEEEKADSIRAEEKILCVQCNNYYCEKDNTMGACIHHYGCVYNNHSRKLNQYNLNQVILKLLNEEAAAVQLAEKGPLKPEAKEKIEHDRQRFKYICCNETVQVRQTMGGCKKGKHSTPTMTLDEWNKACANNTKYQQQLWELFEKR